MKSRVLKLRMLRITEDILYVLKVYSVSELLFPEKKLEANL